METDEGNEPVEQGGSGEAVISAPMVGRTAELETLRRSLRRLLRGDGGIVSLVGEAGIGKSRLVREALAGDDARRARLLVGRSLSVGRTLSFHPFTDLLRDWAGIAGGAADDEAQARLDEATRGVCGDEADEVAPFLAALMGLRQAGAHGERLRGLEGEALERLICKSARTLFARLAAERPLVLFFEDLHWADRSSVRLLEFLLRLVAESPILFVHAFRPEHADTGQHMLAVARAQYPLQHRLIELQPLDAGECAELTRQLLRADDLPPAALARVAERAAGRPFFVEELVRSLVDRGAVELRDGRPHLAGRLDDLVVPSSVREVIAGRLAALDGDSRQLLEVAAVIGRAVLRPLLTDVADRAEGLNERLGGLTERGILLARRTRRTAAHGRVSFSAETEYVFQHALVQESILDALEPARRRELHGRVAAAIEARYADRLRDFHGVLAYHYARTERFEKAEEYLFKAGEEAARAAASSEALACFQEAVTLYLRQHGERADPARLAVLERNIGLALMNTGRLAGAMPHFDRALAHLGDPIPAGMAGAVRQFAGDAAAVMARLVLPRAWLGSPAGQERHRDDLQIRYARIKAQSTSDPTRLLFDYTRAVRLLDQTDPAAVPDQVIGLYSGYAAMFAYSGVSFRVGRRFLAIADGLRRPGHAKDQFDHDCLVCICNYLEGIWDDAAGTVPDELVRAALRHGGLWEVNTYLGLDADRRLRRGDFAGARRRVDQLADLAETYGFGFARTNQMGMTALLLLEQRQLDGALDAANLYLAAVEEPPLRVLALGTKAKAHVLLGDLPAAAAALATAEQVVGAAPIIPPWHLSALATARLHHDLAVLEADASTASAAQRSARAARRVAAKVAVQRGEIRRLTAHLHRLLGDDRRAAAALSATMAECERLGALPELAHAHHDAANWGLDLADGRDRAAHLARAGELFESLGLPWDAAEANAAAIRAA